MIVQSLDSRPKKGTNVVGPKTDKKPKKNPGLVLIVHRDFGLFNLKVGDDF